MADALLDRQVLEERWRKNVQSARLRLFFARTFREEVRVNLRNHAVPSPDGDNEYRWAIEAEAAALAEYGRVLQIFNALIHRNKIPQDSQPMDHSCPEKKKLDEALMVVGKEIRSLETAQLRASPDKNPMSTGRFRRGYERRIRCRGSSNAASGCCFNPGGGAYILTDHGLQERPGARKPAGKPKPI